MRQVTLSQTGAGQSVPIPFDRNVRLFAVAFYTRFTGAVVYSLEYTYDDPFNPPTGGLTWFTDPAGPVGSAGAVEGTYDNPVAAMRINQASGSGTTTLVVNQAGTG